MHVCLCVKLRAKEGGLFGAQPPGTGSAGLGGVTGKSPGRRVFQMRLSMLTFAWRRLFLLV